jgi:O-antigen ligase
MRVVFKVFVIAVVITCLNGLIQYLFGMDLLRGKPLENNRVQSSFRHANDLGAYLALSVPILFTYWLFCYNRWRTQRRKSGAGAVRQTMVVSASITILAMLLLGLTFSRSSWLGFMIAFGFWIVAARKNLVVTLAVVAGFMLFFSPMLIQIRNVSFISDGVQGDHRAIQSKLESSKSTRWERIREQLRISKQRFSGAGRTNFWNAATDVIKAKPVFGIGLNAYSKYFREHQLKYGGYPHNCYLQMAAETGLLGLGAFLFLAGSFFWRILQSVPQVDTAEALIFLGGAAGTLAFLVQSFFDTTLYNIQLAPVPWLMWGFLMVLRSQLAKN